MGIILIIILAIILLFVVWRFLKVPKLGALTLVSGGVKTGKTALSVHLAIRYYKRALRNYYIARFIFRIGRKLGIKKCQKEIEKPLLYSNIPLGKVDYVPLTDDILQRKKRTTYKSIIFIDEMSLVADSMLYKDLELNERLMFFHKLIGHATRGGKLIVDTQSLNDLHYSTERTLSSFIYVHRLIKLPFISLMYLREERFNSMQGVSTNIYDSDIEDSMKLYFLPNSVFKRYDQYAYSYLTDDLPIENNTRKATTLKANNILSFKKWKTIPIDKGDSKQDEKK